MEDGIAAQPRLQNVGKAGQVLDQFLRIAEGLRSDPRTEHAVKAVSDALKHQIPAAAVLLPVVAWLSCLLKKRRVSKKLLAVNAENKKLAAEIVILREQHVKTEKLVRCNTFAVSFRYGCEGGRYLFIRHQAKVQRSNGMPMGMMHSSECSRIDNLNVQRADILLQPGCGMYLYALGTTLASPTGRQPRD